MDPLFILCICILVIVGIRNIPNLSRTIKRRKDHRHYLKYKNDALEQQAKTKAEYDRQRKNMVKL